MSSFPWHVKQTLPKMVAPAPSVALSVNARGCVGDAGCCSARADPDCATMAIATVEDTTASTIDSSVLIGTHDNARRVPGSGSGSGSLELAGPARLCHIPPLSRDTRSQCDPVDTRMRTHEEKRGGGLTRRGDGGPRAQQPHGRRRVLQTDSRDRTRAGVSRQFCDVTMSR